MKFKEFYDEKSKDEGLGKFAFVFGNGFPKSHPDPNVRECFSISVDEYEKLWEVVSLRVKLKLMKHSRNDEESLCPEKLLNFIRMAYGIGIFRKYQEKQKELTSGDIQRATIFLGCFGSIYTLNYDYFSYVSIFSNKQDTKFKDGFCAKASLEESEFTTPLEFVDIEKCLEDKQNKLIPFYFLHGAFHIIQDKTGKYKKVKRSSSKTFAQNVKAIYELIDLGLEGFSSAPDKIKVPDPVLVFSGRTCYKNATLEDDKYLKHSLKKLSEEEKAFTFGCSFKLDTHILDAILEPLKNGKKKEIYLGWYSEEDKKTIEQFLENKASNIDVTLVDLSDTQRAFIHQKVWGVNTPDHQQ